MAAIRCVFSLNKGFLKGGKCLNYSIWMMLTVLLVLSFDARAQTTDWKWIVGAGGELLDEATGITLDQDDNIYISGSFRNTGAFGDTSIVYEGTGSHLFISKLDKEGNWLWVRGAQSSGIYNSAVEADNNGNLYLAGAFFRDIVINDTIHTGPRDVGYNSIVAKLDMDGNWLWSRAIEGNGSRQIYDLALDQSGNIYVTGMASSELLFDDIVINAGHQNPFVAKMDSDGNWLWFRIAYCEGVASSRGIVVDSQGNSYISGYFVREVTLGEITLDPGGHYFRTFVAKLDHDGNWAWAVNNEGAAASEARGIALDGDENLYVTGTFAGEAVFGSHALHTANAMNNNIFIAKTDSSGNWLWVEKAGAGGNRNFGLDIFVSEESNVLLTGFFHQNNSTFGPFSLDAAGARETIFAAKLDQDGNWFWADRAGGTLDNNHGISVIADRNENIYLTGRAGRNASFGDYVHPGFGNASIFLAKLRVDDKETSSESTLELPAAYKLSQNYPNPFNPSTTIEFSLPEAGVVTLTVHDILGRQIATLVSGEMKAGKHTYQWDSGGLSSGVYLYRLRAGDVSLTRKMHIVK